MREPSVSFGEFVTLKLVKPYTGHGRNITMNNFFTNVSIATKLLVKRTTVVGTIRTNRRVLPTSGKTDKGQYDTLLNKITSFKCHHCILTIQKTKLGKKVLVRSSIYTSVENEKNNASIPATIRLYNSTKFGVDVVGPMNRKYTVKSKSRRCPLQVFFKMLSWDKCMDFIKRHHGRRNLGARIFISLGRRTYHRISKEQQLGKEDPAEPITNVSIGSHEWKKCEIKYYKNNKTNKICLKCKKYVYRKRAIEKSIICKNIW